MTLKEDLLENYCNFNARYFANKYGKTIDSIYGIVSKLNLSRGASRTEALKDKILEDYYNNNLLISDIHKKYKIGKSTVGKILEKYGTGGRKPTEYASKYELNEDFFEQIDTPEKAYWFGFIAADGNLHDGKLQIGLSSTDEEHLEKFKLRIDYSGPLHDDRSCKKLTVRRQKFFNDLVRHGMEENKTFKVNENIFDAIPKHLIPAAMHGYFDGDGGFSKSKGRITFELVGNEGFLKMFKELLSKSGIETSEIKKDKRTQQTFFIYKRINADTSSKFKSLFYENAFSSKDFLDRKKEKLYHAIVIDRRFKNNKTHNSFILC